MAMRCRRQRSATPPRRKNTRLSVERIESIWSESALVNEALFPVIAFGAWMQRDGDAFQRLFQKDSPRLGMTGLQ
jgi:hypothetical protein